MKTAAFFGHRNCPGEIISAIDNAIDDLIEHKGVERFLVGHQGRFDSIVLALLRKKKRSIPGIYCRIVLAHMPNKNTGYGNDETLFPEGMELVYPKYAISRRNRWMVDNSDIIIVYVQHEYGGAAEAMRYAVKKGKKVINLASSECHAAVG